MGELSYFERIYYKIKNFIKRLSCNHEFVVVHETKSEIGYFCMHCDKDVYLKLWTGDKK